MIIYGNPVFSKWHQEIGMFLINKRLAFYHFLNFWYLFSLLYYCSKKNTLFPLLVYLLNLYLLNSYPLSCCTLFSKMVASIISKHLLINCFSGFLWGLYQDISNIKSLPRYFKLTIAEIFQTNINQKPKFYAKFVWLIWHVMDERAPSFARKQLFFNGQIKTWLITFFF